MLLRQPPGDRRGLIGSARGKIWMVDDFDEIPEGFESYLGDERESGSTDSNLELPTHPVSRRELRDILKDKLWMAPDFDETPEEFEDYLGDNYEKGC